MLLCISLCFIFLGGCKKWLDKKQTTNVSFPETLTDLQALLDDPKNINEQATPSMLEAAADNYFIQQSEYNNQAGIRYRVSPYTWEDNPYNFPGNDWIQCYQAVNVANTCILQLETIARTSINSEQWDNIKGAAHFIRAYYFLELCWTYAKGYNLASASSDLGIPLRLVADVNEKSVRRNVKESYEQIINDARIAVLYLPNKFTHCLRPSKVAAYGLMGRIFLSMREYDSTLKYANLALQNYDKLMDYNGDPDIINSFSSNSFPFKKYNKEIIFYTSINKIHTTPLPSYARIDTLLYDSYDDSDLRKIAFFKRQGNYQEFKGSYTPQIDNLFSGIAVDELLLTRAECFARLGNRIAALLDLNSLLIKRWKTGLFIPINILSDKAALDIILRERRKELLMRGLRWMDLKRLNLENAGIIIRRNISGQSFELLPNSNLYAQPLPQDVLKYSGMPQNPR